MVRKRTLFTPEQKKMADRANALRWYYKNIPPERQERRDLREKKKFVKELIKDIDNIKKIYDMFNPPVVSESS